MVLIFDDSLSIGIVSYTSKKPENDVGSYLSPHIRAGLSPPFWLFFRGWGWRFPHVSKREEALFRQPGPRLSHTVQGVAQSLLFWLFAGDLKVSSGTF